MMIILQKCKTGILQITYICFDKSESNHMSHPNIILLPLQPEDREQFILDNQWAFKYGAQLEFGMRDERCKEGEEVLSCASTKRRQKGELELLFVHPEVHSKGIGQAAWKAVEAMHPEIWRLSRRLGSV